MGGIKKNINDVIAEEFKIIQKRRWRKNHPYFKGSDLPPLKQQIQPETSSTIGHSEKENQQRCNTLIGLALSGGGIRSAATNLGVLQGLSERNILPRVDYLSTVSGGGYIGACLSSLLTDRAGKPTQPCQTAAFSTEWKNFPFREDKYSYDGDNRLGKTVMKHIRTRASYLAPRARHFSANVMRAMGSVFTSTFMSLLWFALVIIFITSFYMAVVSYITPDLARPPDSNVVASISPEVQSGGKQTFLPADTLKTISAYARIPFQKLSETQTKNQYVPLWLINFSIFFSGTCIFFYVSRAECVCGFVKNKYVFCFLACLISLLLVLATGKLLLPFVVAAKTLDEGALLAIPPLFTGGCLFGIWLSYIAISFEPKESEKDGKQEEERKKWDISMRSHFHQLTGILGIVLLLTLVWAVLPGFMKLGTDTFKTMLLLVIGTGLRYALTRNKNKSEQKNKTFSIPAKYREWLLGFCTFIFVFLVVVYAGNILDASLLGGAWPSHAPEVNWGDHRLWALTGLSLGALVLFPLLVDVNKISPHYFYRDRLSEAFLQTRTDDNCCLRDDAEMRLAELHGSTRAHCAARGPYLLLNATLNLTASNDLKAFNRKSDIFTFSKLYVGSRTTGFIETDSYQVDGGFLKLARAMTISGAAVTSVMGMNSSLAKSFACTILGVRLGYWLPNIPYAPDKEEKVDSDKDGRADDFYHRNFTRLFKELFGHTTAQGKEIYLSDGGHSGDNLGIIPLLQRRVKLLIVSDSECDPNHCFDSFNSSVRNAYVDEGIKIDISLDGLRKDANGLTRDKFAVGRITYPDQNSNQKNWLLLFKNTMIGNEIAPIVNYKEKNDDFPHEGTGDQFFTEEQFESYRALGRFAVYDSFACRENWLNESPDSAKQKTVTYEEVYTFLQGSIKSMQK